MALSRIFFLALAIRAAADSSELETTVTTDARSTKVDANFTGASQADVDGCVRSLPGLRAALLKTPDDYDTLKHYGKCAGMLGRLDEAATFLRSLVGGPHGGANTYRLLAMLDLSRKDFDGAIAAAKELRKLTPLDFRGDEILYSAYAGEESWDDALDVMARAAARDPKNPTTWHLQAIAYVAKKDYARCAQASGRATSLDPRNAEAWSNLGTCRSRLGKKKQALPAFRRAVALAPKEPVFLCNLALADADSKDAAAVKTDLAVLENLDAACAQAARERLAGP